MAKTLKRWYYLLFYNKRCYKASLHDRQVNLAYNKGDLVEYGDLYLGKDWWYCPRYKSKHIDNDLG